MCVVSITVSIVHSEESTVLSLAHVHARRTSLSARTRSAERVLDAQRLRRLRLPELEMEIV